MEAYDATLVEDGVPQPAPAYQPQPATLSSDEIKARYFTLTTQRLLDTVKSQLTPDQYEKVFDFFANHMFMPEDRAGRDQALEVVYRRVKGVNIMGVSTNLRESVELAQLASSLDDGLFAILERRKFTSTEHITHEAIDSAVREEGRVEDRRRQVELLCNNIRFFHKVCRSRMAKLVMTPMKAVAKATGVACLASQIDAGNRLAHAIDDVDSFVDAIWMEQNLRLKALCESDDIN